MDDTNSWYTKKKASWPNANKKVKYYINIVYIMRYYNLYGYK